MNEGARKLRVGDFEYKLQWKEEEIGRGGVVLLVKYDLIESVMEVRKVWPKIKSIQYGERKVCDGNFGLSTSG